MNPLPVEFFGRFGLYAEREFLSPSLCISLKEEMRAATGTAATVAEEDGEAVDETYRRTKQAALATTTSTRIGDELRKAIPVLASHFERALVGLQTPQFLVYRKGDFFRAHPDDSASPDAPDFVRQRSISAVVFLNDPAPPGGAGYSGGSLTFYGLMGEGTTNENVGLPLAGEAGLLVAFPSNLVHSVSPVTAGERYTVVSWFFEEASR